MRRFCAAVSCDIMGEWPDIQPQRAGFRLVLERYVTPAEFDRGANLGMAMGFQARRIEFR